MKSHRRIHPLASKHFKSKLTPPVKPKFEDFGISETDYQRNRTLFDSFDDVTERLSPKIVGFLSIIYAACIAVYILLNDINRDGLIFILATSIFLFPLLLSISLPIIYIFIFLFSLLKKISIKVKLSPLVRKGIRDYSLALKSYNYEINKYKLSYEQEVEKFKIRQKEYWLNLSGIDFEHKVAELLRKDGYQATVTVASGDGGVDIFLKNKDGVAIPIQCKNHSNKVSINDIRAFYGVIVRNNYEKGIIIGSSGFSISAKDYKDKIDFWDINDIIKMVNRLC